MSGGGSPAHAVSCSRGDGSTKPLGSGLEKRCTDRLPPVSPRSWERPPAPDRGCTPGRRRRARRCGFTRGSVGTLSRPCARPPAGHSLPGGRLRKKDPPRRGDATLRGRALDGLVRTRYKTCMRRSRSALLRWGAVVALALLALATAPHFHDEAEARDDTCVLCHVQGSPPIASSVLENPDPSAAGSAHARAPGHARQAEVEGHGSRAPPA